MQVDIPAILAIGGFLITIGTLVWRMAVLHQQCITNKETIKRAHDRIDKLEDTQSHKIEDLTKELHIMKESQVRMEEKLNQLLRLEKEKSRTGGNHG
jgi:predicted  nucleic acid-binding Zn-ribbon protein